MRLLVLIIVIDYLLVDEETKIDIGKWWLIVDC